MNLLGGRSRGGHGALLVGLSLYTVLTAWLLRLPCRVPGWGAAENLPALCATGIPPGAPTGAGGFFTGGPAGDQPALVGMISTALAWLSARLSAPAGADGEVFADLSVLLLALVWVGTVAAVSGLSAGRGPDAFALALAPVVVLVGFSTWDLLAVLLMMLALLLHVRGSPVPAGIVLGLAASVALFPLVVLLAVLLLGVRYRQFRDVALVLTGTVLTWALVSGPFLLSARDRWARQFSTPEEAPVAGPSLWGVWARVEQARTGAPPDPADGGQYVLLALVLGFVAVLVLTLLTRQEPSVVQIAFLLLAVLVLSGPAYSLVHVLWLAPLVLLSRRSWPEFAAWQLVEVLWWTTLVLPEPAWPVLPGLGPLGWDAQDLLAAVRVLLLVLLAVAVTVDVLRGGRARRIGLSEPG